TTFRRLSEGRPTLEVVVRFLALLELFKDGRVDLRQAAPRGDIDVAWVGTKVRDRDEADPELVDTYS
ncbi:MAG TPA: segregation/condensation protein A, partial [Acidimicrobiales bacterium]|nr:segregation/condensation protein A [Acidimicrobiales bacterium]